MIPNRETEPEKNERWPKTIVHIYLEVVKSHLTAFLCGLCFALVFVEVYSTACEYVATITGQIL